MKKILNYGATSVLSLMLILVVSGTVKSDEYGAGESLFKQNCQFCHHLKGDGNYPSTFYLQFRPKDFADSDSWKGLDDHKIASTIQKGKGAMPRINLKPEEIKAIIDYMTHKLKN